MESGGACRILGTLGLVRESTDTSARASLALMKAELGQKTSGSFSDSEGELGPAERRSTITEFDDLANHEATSVKQSTGVAKQARTAGSESRSLPLDSLASDSEKHQRILRFIEKRLGTS
jgi:hypothetical protein